jgi:hypothetical protein
MEQEKQTPPLEDIPLQDFIPTPTVSQPTPQDCVSPETAAAQLEKYKIKIGTSIEIALKYLLPNDKWQLIPPTPPSGGGVGGAISLFELPDQTSPYYNLKAVAVCQGRASRYFHVIKDHDPHTRMPWDKDNVTHIQQMETYMAEEGEIVVVESTWKSKNPYLFSNRHVLGIMSHHFDPELATYSLYFTTTEHYHFKSPPSPTAGGGGGGEVSAQVLLCVILRKLTDETTEVTIMLRIDPNLSRFSTMSLFFENKYKEELRKRVALYEFVVQRWNVFYGPKNDPKKIENRR